jgi:hypothetical protein
MPGLTPQQFVNTRRGVMLKEHSALQSHFIDLCRLLDQPTLMEAVHAEESYAFEHGAGNSVGLKAAGKGSTHVSKHAKCDKHERHLFVGIRLIPRRTGVSCNTLWWINASLTLTGLIPAITWLSPCSAEQQDS